MYPIIDKKKTALRIRCMMEAKGDTPQDIAKYLSLSCVQTVYRWLEGTNLPSMDNLYALSARLGVSVDALLAGNREEIWERKRRMAHIFLYAQLLRQKLERECV